MTAPGDRRTDTVLTPLITPDLGIFSSQIIRTRLHYFSLPLRPNSLSFVSAWWLLLLRAKLTMSTARYYPSGGVKKSSTRIWYMWWRSSNVRDWCASIQRCVRSERWTTYLICSSTFPLAAQGIIYSLKLGHLYLCTAADMRYISEDHKELVPCSKMSCR